MLSEIYRLYRDCELEELEDEELAEIKHEVPVTVLSGVSLKLTDIFMYITH
jgi:hypothetical protein